MTRHCLAIVHQSAVLTYAVEHQQSFEHCSNIKAMKQLPHVIYIQILITKSDAS